ncbi:MAG: cytochrome-c peroxidase [Flavobacterium sp.]|nr:cytochrome-c peroxidase [Candidatus Neoflavobacterium equi]
MKRIVTLLAIGICSASLLSIKYKNHDDPTYYSIEELRKLYSSGDVSLWPKATIDSSVVNFKEIGILGSIPFPEENPFSKEKRALGKMLFFDPRLSKSGQIACASCHDPALAWGDGKPVSHGHDRQAGIRNSKSLLNVAYTTPLFWDGRAQTLEEQIEFPVKDPAEMANHIDLATKSIKKVKGYKPLFKEAFGDEEITKERIIKAIATFERTITSKKSKFDLFVQGDAKQLNDKELTGLHLFRTKARCINCHNSGYFSDNQFHNVGLSYYKRKYEDLGVYARSQNRADLGKFKTPSLRDVSKTGPYMHNGLFPTLRGVLNMYNAGMPNRIVQKGYENDPMYPRNSEILKVLNLNEEELHALESFLEAISTTVYREPAPEVLPK